MAARGDEEQRDTPTGLEHHLREFLRDPALGPIVAVVGIIAATLGAWLLSFALQRNPFAMAALAILIVLSGRAVFADLRQRRLGIASAIVAALWIGSAAITAVWARIGTF